MVSLCLRTVLPFFLSDHHEYSSDVRDMAGHSQEKSATEDGYSLEENKQGQLSRAPSLASPETVRERSTVQQVIVVLTVTFAMIVNVANSTSVSISLPTIGRDLNVPQANLFWLVSAYPLSSGCLLLVFGRLADIYGRKKVFLLGNAFLGAITLGCAFPTKVLTLEVLRGIQGIGSAAVIPASLGILAETFPPSRARSMAFATFSAGAPIGSVFGTAIGGVLTQYTENSWRSNFYLMTGIVFLCFVGGLFFFDKDEPSPELDQRVDWLGAFLVTAGLVLIVFVLGQGELAPKQWATPYIIALLIVGVILVVLFVCWQMYLERIQDSPHVIYSVFTPPPLMKISLWKRGNGRFAAMMLVAFLNWCSFLGWTFWTQLYYQDYKNLPPILTVVRFLPMFVSGMLCNLFIGVMAARISLVYLAAIGTLCTAAASLLFALMDTRMTYWAFGFPAATIVVVGADFVYAAGTLFIAKISLPHEQSLAGGLFQTMTQLGTSVGITVTTVVFNRVTSRNGPDVDNIASYRAAQWTSFAFGILGTLLSILFFKGVGVVGHRKPPTDADKTATNSEQEIKA